MEETKEKKIKTKSKAKSAKVAADVASADDDEPVLSHKARRKKRKLDALAADEGDEPAPKRTAVAAGPTPAKGAFGVWVGNLAFSTTAQHLATFFERGGCGPVARTNMPVGKKKGEINRGSVCKCLPK